MYETFRILDANLNRAREALRVIEDFARFALNDAHLSEQAKGLRSRLQRAAAHWPAEALLAARDTPGDVGTAITSPTEYRRADASAVAVAACKRLTEALRTLEEYAKIVGGAPAQPSPPTQAAASPAAAFEAMRYEAYTLEQRLAWRTNACQRFERVRLYVLLTTRLCRQDILATAEQAIAGGADCLQLREKEMTDCQVLALAHPLRELTTRHDVLFIMNDRADLAAACAADSVHLGQDDLPVAAARRLLPPGALIGRSTHTAEQVRAAMDERPDYVALGPMFPTATKDAGPLAGVALLRAAAAVCSLAHVCVGGITADNIAELVAAGARRVAVCSAVISAADPRAAAEAIRRCLPG